MTLPPRLNLIKLSLLVQKTEDFQIAQLISNGLMAAQYSFLLHRRCIGIGFSMICLVFGGYLLSITSFLKLSQMMQFGITIQSEIQLYLFKIELALTRK